MTEDSQFTQARFAAVLDRIEAAAKAAGLKLRKYLVPNAGLAAMVFNHP